MDDLDTTGGVAAGLKRLIRIVGLVLLIVAAGLIVAVVVVIKGA